MLRLTLLTPAIVEATMDGHQGAEVTLAVLLEPFPTEWDAQQFKHGEVRAKDPLGVYRA